MPTKDAFGNATSGDNRDKLFLLKNGVSVYGGFVGNETALSQRNFIANPTILSADLGTANNNTDNAYHVVLAYSITSTTNLDGFTIKNANANGVNSGNSDLGFGSSTWRVYGAGILIGTNANLLQLHNLTISNNNAFIGAGIYSSNSNYRANNLAITNNAANNFGGGIYNQIASPSLNNITITNNTADQGSGIYNDRSNTSITNATITNNNSGLNNGGAVYNESRSNPIIKNTIIWGNTGSGIQGIFNDNDDLFYVSNPTVSYSNIQGGYAGTGNINNNPNFINLNNPAGADGIFMTADDGLRLGCNSPSFNTGTNTDAPTTDILGAARPAFTTADMGAYESQISLLSPTIIASITTAPTTCGGTDGSIAFTSTNIPYGTYSLTYTGTGSPQNVTVASNTFLLIGLSAGTFSNFSLTTGVCTAITTATSTIAPSATCATSTNDFVTVWDLNVAGSGATQLSFGVATAGIVNYTWTASGGATGFGTFSGATCTITGLPANNNITLNIQPTNFQRFIMNRGADRSRIREVKQWGTVAWTNMERAFYGCNNVAFLISTTDTPNLSGVTNMANMFLECSFLNSPSNINTWNVSSITNMNTMFADAAAFNQDISTWNVSNVTIMSVMFAGAKAFNQNISTWNVSNVTNMGVMFSGATAFNQNISNWNVQNVNTMSFMFNNATSFNQNIGAWNVSNVSDMSFMFNSATSFNQNIGAWNLKPNVYLDDMLNNSGLDCTNYSATLQGWATKPTCPTGRDLGATGMKYNPTGATARTTLITAKTWTISGDTAVNATTTLASSTNPTCGSTNGSITLTTANVPNGSYELNYTKNAVSASTTVIVGASALTITGLGDGVYSNFELSNVCTPINISVATLTTPIVPIVYVNKNATGLNNGISWIDAFVNLQDGINACGASEVWVAAGTYLPSKDANGNETPTNLRSKTFLLKNGVSLYGGFNGTETLLSQRNWTTNPTILSGDLNNNDDVTIVNNNLTFSNNDENVFHVVLTFNLTTITNLDGFTVKSGNANGGFTLVDLGFGFDFLNRNGAGIYSTSCNVYLKITNTALVNNFAENLGGGFYNNFSDTSLDNVIITNNKALKGGGIYNRYSKSKLTNVTLANNIASENAHGIYNYSSVPVIKNTIIRSNLLPIVSSFVNFAGPIASITTSNIQDGYVGTGNIDSDPLFTDIADPDGADNIFMTADDGLRLSCGSACYNAGVTATTDGIDILGNPRVAFTNVDMGAYESTTNLIIPITPTITANGATTICSGSSVVLTSSATSGNVWSNGATSQSITVSQAGNYSVAVTANGCTSATATVTSVIVTPLPVTPTISANGATTICSGSSVVLTSSAISGNVWSNGATSQSITVSQAGNYSVAVTANGCTSATSTVTSVIVTPLPITPTITANGATTICSGSSVVLTSSATSGNVWSNGATTQSITVSQAGDYSVAVNANGCTSATSTVTSVIITPLPVTPTITANGATTICAGSSLVLTSSATSGNIWSNGATTQSITVSQAGDYSVAVNANGCTSATSTVTSVIVTPLPITPTITANGATTICGGSSVTLTSSATSGNIWSNGATTQSITVSQAGDYSVAVNANGCTSATSTVTSIIVTPLPVTPTISANGATTICSGSSVVLTSSATSGNVWSNGATSQSITVSQAGNYSVAVNANGCTSATSTITSVIVNLVTLSPNGSTLNYTVGIPIASINLAASGVSNTTYTYTISNGSLPIGVSLVNGVISGNPTTVQSGSFTITATAVSGSCSANQTFSYNVTCPTINFLNSVANTATIGVGYNINASVNGNTQIIFYSINPILPAGLNINTTTGIISGTPTTIVALTTYTVTATQGTCVQTQEYSFAVVCPNLQFVTTTLPNRSYNVVYSQSLSVINGTNVTYSILSGTLPIGLSLSSSGLISGTSIAFGTSTFVILATDANGCSVSKTFSIGINQKPITVTTNAASKVYGTTDPVLTYSFSPQLQTGESFTGSLSRVAGENVGNYAINQGTLSAGANYIVNFVNANFSITKATQTITWNQDLFVGCDGLSTNQLVATASSGLPITYTSQNSNIATIVGSILNSVGQGTTSIVASQVGDNNYFSANDVIQSIVVSQPNLIRKHWNDAIFFDNSSNNYSNYQWFKNGVAVVGANQQYFKENGNLLGTYYATATKNGMSITTCPLTFIQSTPEFDIRIIPNPVFMGNMFEVETTIAAASLLNAQAYLFSNTGSLVSQTVVIAGKITMVAPNAQGVYIVRLILNNGQMYSANLLVK